jgi:hypothetical protein
MNRVVRNTQVDDWMDTFGTRTFPCTIRNVELFVCKQGSGRLIGLFGGRSNNHFLDYERLTKELWQIYRDFKIPGISATFELPYISERFDDVENNLYTGANDAVRESLERHLDDRHDLYQNLPYHLEAIEAAFGINAAAVGDYVIMASLVYVNG